MASQYIVEGDNPDLSQERRKATFRVDSLSELLYGVEHLKSRRMIAKLVDTTPELHDTFPTTFMSREEKVENAARKIVALMKYLPSINSFKFEDIFYYQSLVMHVDGHPLSLHGVMFVPLLMQQTDEEQRQKWLPRAIKGEIIGTYAQTELGHGTNVRQLETTATYDADNEQFIVNSPTVTSTKWWPGNLGKVSNYAIVVAQLYVKGNCYGPHQFIVQLRDENTHLPLPGITIGDIGPKFGINTNDNGFLRLNNVRIPRKQMLMRYSKVTQNGQYIRPIHEKLGYGGMVFVRSVMVSQQALFLAIACTVGIRYSCVRRQGEITPGSGEVKVLEYQTQQYRLFPQLARAYACWFAGKRIMTLYAELLDGLNENKTDLLPQLHALSSGLKAVVTHQVALGIEQCRMACGGHGYSNASALPELYGTAVGGCTYEGDNIVLLLQTARFLMKMAKMAIAMNMQSASVTTKYLFRDRPTKSSINQYSALDHSVLIEAFEHIACRLIFTVYNRIENLKKCGRTREEACNECSVDLCKASRAHTRLFIAQTLSNTIAEITDRNVAAVMNDVATLYLAHELVECAAGLLELSDDYFSGQQVAYLRSVVYKAMNTIRPNAVPLVDAFDINDREMNSVLGRRDGNVYENLLQWAQLSPLNKTDVITAYIKHLGPYMKQERSKI
ncbi:putative peroxisomal acyl-coenzyme A oxidase [Toxocara canis]|uniref:Acyl-coenzyme A oxidase n=1 Tax=Toxocara canis TaxID=6265 RepID=A0A0B2VQL9_TOXCA|nr:putative peroxisomal acyl-coenzyme A oxidase [Toxocara canis]